MSVDINIILDAFSPKNAPFLTDKPKLFFIQACRGGLFRIAIYIKNTNWQIEQNEFADKKDAGQMADLAEESAKYLEKTSNDETDGNG